MVQSTPFVSSLYTVTSSKPNRTNRSGNSHNPISETLTADLFYNFHSLLERKQVHAHIIKLTLLIQSSHFPELAPAFAESDSLNDAIVLFYQLRNHNREDVDGAYALFSQMPVRSWTTMIAGFVQCGKPKEAISLFTQMEEAGLRPNVVTVVAVLTACADLRAIDLGRKIHEYSERSGYSRNIHICNILIDMYIKCGCLEVAHNVFEEMEYRTIIGIKPNGVTFIGQMRVVAIILYACSHMGLTNEGHRIFASMNRDYGRAALLQEAYELIMNMPIEPNGVVWGDLPCGCKVHMNIEMAEEVTKHLLELDPLNDGYYTVLSNIYAEAKRWEDVTRVRKLLRDRGVKKTPGWSSITVDGVVHEFVAGDETLRRYSRDSVSSLCWVYIFDTSKICIVCQVSHLYTKDATRSWKLVGSEGSNRLSIKEPSANILLLDYVSSEKWKDIIDFDDHLDDISKDWLNSELFNYSLTEMVQSTPFVSSLYTVTSSKPNRTNRSGNSHNPISETLTADLFYNFHSLLERKQVHAHIIKLTLLIQSSHFPELAPFVPSRIVFPTLNKSTNVLIRPRL
ncbi:unnamed protein product [Ilex paraguariensis]|uniref:Pentatricopeptide repeat-containing protein n=1 Tax=Ilex paraguariensis TaxID=185542 RepID=A0ABC8RKJ6_9AQUA